jgi:hypothetical protein
MIFRKDNFILGITLGSLAPVLGILLFKVYRLPGITTEDFWLILTQPGHRILTAAMSFSLLLNAALFTLYINFHKDHTAKGIFVTTLIYGLIILSIKFLT